MKTFNETETSNIYEKFEKSPLRLFFQDEIPDWKKNGLNILLFMFCISGTLLLINMLFLRTYDHYFYYQYAVTIVLFFLNSFYLKKLMASYNVNPVRKPSYDNLFLLLGAVLKTIRIYEKTKHTQGSVKASILDNYPIKNLGERKTDGIFAEANKRHKIYHNK